jgi:hypothetical protein
MTPLPTLPADYQLTTSANALRGLRLLAIREEHRLSLLVFKIEMIRQYAERAMLSGAQAER